MELVNVFFSDTDGNFFPRKTHQMLCKLFMSFCSVCNSFYRGVVVLLVE